MVVNRRKSHKSKQSRRKTGKKTNQQRKRGQKAQKVHKRTRRQHRRRIVQSGGFTNPFGGVVPSSSSVTNFFKSSYNTLNPPPPSAASNPANPIQSPKPFEGHYNRTQPAPSANDMIDLKKSFQGV